jgi:hypothetical protein
MPIQGLKHSKSAGHYAGHEVEPAQPHGPKQGGRHPISHSHSAHPKHARKLTGRKVFGGRK